MGVVLWFSHVHRIVFFGFFRNRNIVYVSSTLSGTTAKIEEGGTPQASRLRSRLLPCGALDRLDRPEDLETHSLFNPARSKHLAAGDLSSQGRGNVPCACKNALIGTPPISAAPAARVQRRSHRTPPSNSFQTTKQIPHLTKTLILAVTLVGLEGVGIWDNMGRVRRSRNFQERKDAWLDEDLRCWKLLYIKQSCYLPTSLRIPLFLFSFPLVKTFDISNSSVSIIHISPCLPLYAPLARWRLALLW